jgi:hypothetical protein
MTEEIPRLQQHEWNNVKCHWDQSVSNGILLQQKKAEVGGIPCVAFLTGQM